MPIIIPPKNKKDGKKEKLTKIIIYFRKEFDALDTDTYRKILEAIKIAQDLDLFDDIYIVKGKDILDLMEFREQYHAAALNELKYLKKEVLTLKAVVHNLIKVIKNIRKHLEKIYQKV